jgi:dissimilatory sulfite reductase (desulfoviridin) alpha/beta subunit
VEKEVLDKWMQYPPEQNIIEVCDHWLRNPGGQPTWIRIAEALKKVGFQQLASDIEKVYQTGKPY